MNPLEMIDIKQQQMLNSINDNNSYKSKDVKELLIKAFAFAKQAYMSGDFIFELESFDNDKVTVDGAVYKVSKMLAEKDKYNIIIQMMDVPEGDMTQSDMAQLSSVMKQAVHNNPNINGVILLPPNYDITLMSAKLNTSDYEFPVEFSEEEINNFVRSNSTLNKWNPKEYSLKHKVPTDMINQLYQKHFVPDSVFKSSDEEDISNPFWEE